MKYYKYKDHNEMYMHNIIILLLDYYFLKYQYIFIYLI